MNTAESPSNIVRKHPRAAGLILASLGVALLAFFTVCPALDAMREAPQVRWLSAKGTVLGFAFAVIGIYVAVGGERALQYLNPPAGASKKSLYAVCILLAAAGLALYFAVKAYIETLGYGFNS